MTQLNPRLLDAMLFVQRRRAAEADRRERYKRNWNYYHGIQKRPLKVRQGQSDDNVIINLARLIVDKGASFLFGKEVGFELQEGEQTEEESILDEIWQRNNKMTFLGKLAVSGGIYGHVFVKILPNGIAEGIPRLVSLSPEYMTVFWDEQDIESVWKYRIEWTATDRDGTAIHRRQDVTENESGTWDIENRISKSGGRWEPDPKNPDLAWGYSWPPILGSQNIALPDAYYGLSDLEDISEQDAINYVASKVNRILRYHSHPKAIGRGFAPDDIKIAVDETLVLPSAESELYNLEMQSDLGSSLAFMDRLISWFLATARIPRVDPATVNVGALSGFALRVLYGDLLEKTEVKRRTYGDMLIELNRRLLDLAGKGEDNICTLHWSDPLPEDYAAQEKRDKFDADYGLATKETLRARRGIDHEVEEERFRAQEAADGNIGKMLLRNFQTAQGTLQRQEME